MRSAYDAVLENAVPEKGSILTKISQFWFQLLQESIPDLPTHFVCPGLPENTKERLRSDLDDQVLQQLEARSMVVKKMKMLPIESIVRGYITGSAWSSYRKDGTVNGVALVPGLRESQKLERPIWTPSTKAEIGLHDENISPQEGLPTIPVTPFSPSNRA